MSLHPSSVILYNIRAAERQKRTKKLGGWGRNSRSRDGRRLCEFQDVMTENCLLGSPLAYCTRNDSSVARAEDSGPGHQNASWGILRSFHFLNRCALLNATERCI